MSPFDPVLLDHNQAQIDFILEMYQREHPKEFTFTRAGAETPKTAVVAQTRWADVLTGDSLRDYMRERMPNARVLERLKAAQRLAMTPPTPGKKI